MKYIYHEFEPFYDLAVKVGSRRQVALGILRVNCFFQQFRGKSLGFPLHPPGKPSDERARHLFEVKIPMLFLQGTRDALAGLSLIEPLCKRLGDCATFELFEAADHSFHVPARKGRTDAETLEDLLDKSAAWVNRQLEVRQP